MFTETNTGNIGKFDPITETFTEFDNPTWPDGGRSMMWGIDYAPDGSVWFTDELMILFGNFLLLMNSMKDYHILLMVILYLKNFELMVLKL